MDAQKRTSLLAAMPPTRFRKLGRIEAIAIALATLIAALALIHTSLSYHGPAPAASGAQGDVATYGRIVERIRHGEGYYAATHIELLKGGYSTRSVFNWRLPTLAWLASRLPSLAWATALLWLVILGAVVGAFQVVRRTGGLASAIALVPALALNLVTCAAPSVVLFTDVTTGVLILASAIAYGLELCWLGMAVALFALFVRELAGLYVVICIILAWRARRSAELLAWALGLLAFAGYFFWHYRMVEAQLGAHDLKAASNWLAFGGLDFVLGTANFNGLMLAKPLWATAILLPLCLFGLCAWRGVAALRIGGAVAAYIVLFMVFGMPYDEYWGALYTPLMMFGLPFVPAGLRDLVSVIRRDSKDTGATEALL